MITSSRSAIQWWVFLGKANVRFSGIALHRWTANDAPKFESLEGLIPGSASKGWLESEAKLVDFVLQLEFRVAEPGSKGAVLVRAWDGDKGRSGYRIAVEDPAAFNAYVGRLEQASGTAVGARLSSLLDALGSRHDAFHATGCRASDHGLETAYAEECTEQEAADIFARALAGRPLSMDQVLKFKSAVLLELCVMDHAKGWVQQFHVGAVRNTNPRAFRTLGPDTGYDSIGDFQIGLPLVRLLGKLEDRSALARTIIYNLNPADNEMIASMIGSFQGGLFEKGGPPPSLGGLAYAPADSIYVTCGNVDVPGLHRTAMDLGGFQLAMAVAVPLERDFGLKLEEDLCDLLGPEMTFLVAPNRCLIPDVALVCESKDAARLEKNLVQLFSRMKWPAGQGVSTFKLRDVTVHAMALGHPKLGNVPVAPTFGIVDGRLVVSPYPLAFQRILAVKRGDRPSIERNQEFGKLRAAGGNVCPWLGKLLYNLPKLGDLA